MSTQILAGPEVEVLDEYRPTMPVFDGKYLSITTYRRDGTPVSTPVWFVEENGRLLVMTESTSGKVKRIRRDPNVSIALCTARGRVRGTTLPARAEILSPASPKHVKRLVSRKYRIDLIFVKPIRALQSIFSRTPTAAEEVVLAITPAGVH